MENWQGQKFLLYLWLEFDIKGGNKMEYKERLGKLKEKITISTVEMYLNDMNGNLNHDLKVIFDDMDYKRNRYSFYQELPDKKTLYFIVNLIKNKHKINSEYILKQFEKYYSQEGKMHLNKKEIKDDLKKMLYYRDINKGLFDDLSNLSVASQVKSYLNIN